MSDIEITMEAGAKKRLLTAGKYCDKNILVTAEQQGGGTAAPTPPEDGKTRLYIRIAPSSMEGQPPPRNKPTLYFSQTVSNGVTIDWGDNTAPETVSGTGDVSTSHVYEAAGDYAIALTVADGCEVGMVNPSWYGILGEPYNVALIHAIIGENVTNIGEYAFSDCCSLSSITISDSVTSIEMCAFFNCNSLSSINIPDSVTSIQGSVFTNCSSLSSITIPNSVTSIDLLAFSECGFVKVYNILPATPPSLRSENAFMGSSDDCIFYVPAESVDAYKTASQWSKYADRIQALP